MPRDNNIMLSLSEWNSFERTLNTYNAEREARAEAFLSEYDSLISVRETDQGAEIDVPWLNETEMLSLVGADAEKRSSEVVSTMECKDGFPTYTPNSANNSREDLYPQAVLRAKPRPMYSNLPNDIDTLLCA